MTLAQIVNATISANTKGVTRKGFGVAMIAAYHTHYADRVRSYTDLTGMISDGFLATDAAYLDAQSLLSGTNKVEKFKIGRRALPPTQITWITPTLTTAGETLKITVQLPSGVRTAITRVNGGGETVATLCTAWAALLDALAASTCADSVTRATFTATTAGQLFFFDGVYGFDLYDKTVDPGLATDLAAIKAADTDWYGLLIDSNSEAEIDAAASWCEAEERVFFANSADAAVRNATATGVSDDLFVAQYHRTALFFSEDGAHYIAARVMGEIFPLDPGSYTVKFKTASGVAASSLTSTQESNIESKNANHYQIVAGIGIVQQGVMASGEFIDVIIGRDWLVARLRERVYQLLTSVKKVPFTDPGVDMIVNVVKAQLKEAVGSTFLAADPAPLVTAPKVSTVSAADKALRKLPNVQFTGTVAGAIHVVSISGTISL